ncbi:MAG: hypothetical protein QM661_09485 [Solimonas sp.]
MAMLQRRIIMTLPARLATEAIRAHASARGSKPAATNCCPGSKTVREISIHPVETKR